MDDELLLRVIAGKASPEESRSVAAWTAASLENARHYRELERLLGDAADWYRAPPIPPAPSAQSIIRAAASPSPDRQRPATRVRLPRPAASHSLIRFAAAVVLLAGGYAIMRGLTRDRDVPLAIVAVDDADASTQSLQLNDGTRIRLANGSQFRIEPTADRRQVWLQGRAEFSVVHDAKRPFRVRTPVGNAEDLGTRFVVRADEGATQVAVFEGRVAIDASGRRLELTPGEVGLLEHGGALELVGQGDQRQAAEWLNAALVFQGTSVAAAAAQLGARYHLTVRVADSILAKRTVTAWFVEPPTARQAVTAICRAVDARCRISDSLIVMYARPR